MRELEEKKIQLAEAAARQKQEEELQKKIDAEFAANIEADRLKEEELKSVKVENPVKPIVKKQTLNFNKTKTLRIQTDEENAGISASTVRPSVRASTRSKVFQVRPKMVPVDVDAMNTFDGRFGDTFNTQPTAKQSARAPKMSMRKKTVKKAKAQALAEDDDEENGYDNEEDYGDEYDDEEFMIMGYSQFDI